MFEIKFKIVSFCNKELEDMDEMTFRYDFLLGNVKLVSNDATIEMEWGWIPLLDFSICLFLINKKLSKNPISKDKFEFTDSDQYIEFLRNGNFVIIKPSFSDNVISTTLKKFEMATNLLFVQIEDIIKEQDSSILINNNFINVISVLQL